MGLVLLWLALAGATQLWLCFRVARSSVGLAIVTFFLGPVGALYTLFKHHGDEETSVTVPFVANFVFSMLLLFSGWQLAKATWREQMEQEAILAAQEEEEPEFDASAGLPPRSESPPTAPSRTVEPEPVAVQADPIDAYSAALRQAGLAHSITRVPAGSSEMPAGVIDAAQIAAPMQADGASVPQEFSVTLLRCATIEGCRELAGAYMRQSVQTGRIIQNGPMLLVVPHFAAGTVEEPLAIVTSSFKQLSP